MNKEQLLNEYFLDTRASLLDIAAFIDRLDRAPGETDFRWMNLQSCLTILHDHEKNKTRRILERLSDPTLEPIDTASTKNASGAWPGFTASDK